MAGTTRAPEPGSGPITSISASATRARQALDEMLRERSAGDGPAVLTNPINIGIGTA